MVQAYKDGKKKAQDYIRKMEMRGRANYFEEAGKYGPEFLKRHKKLKDVREELRMVASFTEKALAPAKFIIVTGYRSVEEQLEKFKKGFSKVKFGQHNYMPSRAVDIAPIDGRVIPWDDVKQFSNISGIWKVGCDYLKSIYKWTCECGSGDNWDKGNWVGRKGTFYDPGHKQCVGD